MGLVRVPCSSFFSFPGVTVSRSQLSSSPGGRRKWSAEGEVEGERTGPTPLPASEGCRGLRLAGSLLITPVKFAATPLSLLQRQKPKKKFSERAQKWLWANCLFF